MDIQKDKIIKRATDDDLLDERINKNIKSQRVDLVKWIFDRIEIIPGSYILELCCGTGNQTLKLLELVDTNGKVVAIDISDRAIEKLKNKVPDNIKDRLVTVVGSIDNLKEALQITKCNINRFDMIFCAYGLYYSKAPEKVLKNMFDLLKDDGKIVVIGPFGPNNKQLFDFLEMCGVKIPDYVLYTSRDFMEKIIIPFATRNFQKINIYTLVNQVIWKNQKDIIKYWENSTFFDESKKEKVIKNLKNHFKKHDEFINDKWIMIVKIKKKII